MKYILNAVCVAIVLSACTALHNGEYAAASEVATASDVVSGSESASDVAQPVEQPTIKVATENTKSVDDKATENDITVLPIATPKNDNDKVTKSTTKNDKNDTNVKLNVTLRNQPKTETIKKTKTTKTDKTTKSTATKTVKMVKPVVKLPPPPPPKPVLTRRQVLEKEIARERAALQSAKAQLAAAQKSGNAKNIAKLNATVKDRELNIRAIETEMKR